MPTRAAFNVEVLGAGGGVLVHQATAANSRWNSTYLDHPQANNNPKAILIVTQNYNHGGASGTYNNHHIGVWYDTSRSRWAVFNQDRVPMPIGATFNVEVLGAGATVSIHQATGTNIAGNFTNVSSPASDKKPKALLFITANYNPGGIGGTYNNHATGVWYNSGVSQWSIYNEDRAAMPSSAAFNVRVR